MTGREHLHQIAHLARSVSSALALETVLKKVTAAVVELLPEAGCVIRMVDEEAGGYRLAAQGGAAAEGFPPLVPFGEGLTHAVVAGRRPVLVSDGSADPRSASRSWAVAGPLRGYYGIPIDAGDEVFGVLSVLFPTGEVPPENVREMFELLAGQAAAAIHNARLFAHSEAQRRAAEGLAAMARAVSESLDPDEVEQRIVDGVRALFGAATAGFYGRAPKSGDLVAVAFAGNVGEASKEQLVFPLGISAVGLAVRDRMAVVTRDVLADPRITLTPEIRARIQKAAYRSTLAVPLMAHDRVIGALAIGDQAGRVFTDDDVRLAEACAHQAALALENAWLYREATQRRREAQELARLARLLTESLDVQAVAERIVQSLLPLVGARSSGLFLVQGDRSLRAVAWGGRARDHFEVGQVVPSGTGISGRALATGMPSWTPDLMTDPSVVLTDDLRQRVGAMGSCAVIAVPLRVKGKIVGVLSVSDDVAREFSSSQVALLESFADHAAIALENARLYAETERRRREAEQLARVARHLTETLDAEIEEALAGLKTAQEGLVRAETLRAVGELAAGAAHHLNNLLTVVIGRLDLALVKLQAPALRRYLEPALKAARDSAEVVRRVQAFAHVNQVHLAEPVDVNELVVDVIELTRPRWREEPNRRGLHITVSLEPGEIPPVHAGPAALREVLVNLMLNAIDALPRGGRIVIRTWAAQGWVYCAVSDTGVGMTPDIQRRALEPFFTTKGVKSTGLGLSVSYGILRRHGGYITIEGGTREGTTVTFRLPVGEERPETPPEVPAAQPAPMTILVIDDELEVRATLVDMLEEQGHVVHQAASGAEGLTALAGLSAIDVVFTDLGMPGMTGWEVARAIKARRPTLPVVLVTGWGTGSETGPERDAVDLVLAKPLTNAGLRAAIAEVAARRPPLGQ